LSAFTQYIRNFFSESGTLSESEGFEYRSQQQDMAEAVAACLEGSYHEIIEAPTGTGKSIAYLVPSIIFAKEKKRKAIVSTRTINLQEQLIKKDIPGNRFQIRNPKGQKKLHLHKPIERRTD
jgi:ATP-dependent DNA helicase DinG